MGQKKGGPIYPEELQRYRDQITIGQQKVMETQIQGDDFRLKKVREVYTVVEKYRNFFVGRTASGSRRNITYIEMLIEERDGGERK